MENSAVSQVYNFLVAAMIRVWGKKLTQKELTLLSVLTVHFEEP